MESKGVESPVADIRMIRMFNDLKEEFKEDIQTQFNESQETMDKNLEKTQKQISEFREDFNKLQNETMETIKK
jgi:hypothetical protein